MKFFALLTLFISISGFAATEVDVLSHEFGFEDINQKKSLCLTVVRFPKNGKVMGILETIEDCYYARLADDSKSQRISINMKDLKKISNKDMKNYLQTLSGELEFYFSEVE